MQHLWEPCACFSLLEEVAEEFEVDCRFIQTAAAVEMVWLTGPS